MTARTILKTNHRYKTALLLAPLALLALPGCGTGSGSSSTSSTSNGTSTTRAALNVYVTDAFSDQYKQVIATLYKVELTTDGTNYVTVFSDTNGHTLDLASLSATSEFLNSLTVPTGTYTKARVTFGDHFTLVTSSGTSSSVAVDSSVGTQAGGQVALVVNTPTKVQAGQTNAVYVDFRLAEFQLTGGALRPQIGCGGNDQFGGRPRTAHLQGTLSNLSSTGFTLTTTNGNAIAVMLTSATTITSGQSGSTVTLANGNNVLVEGTGSAGSTSGSSGTPTITATAVTLNDYTTFPRERASGTVASINTSASSFVLTVTRADGLQPTGGTITVVTNSSTQFATGPQTTGSLSDITVGQSVNVGGSFDVPSQTLTANFVGERPAGGPGGFGGPGDGGHGGGH